MKTDLFKVIEDQGNIWSIDDVHDEELRKQVVKEYSFTYKIQRILWWTTAISIFSRYPLKVLGYNMVGITKICVEIEQEWLYWFFVSCQATLVIICMLVLPALDIIFFGACTTVSTQFKITNYIIQNIDHRNPSLQRKFIWKYVKLLQ